MQLQEEPAAKAEAAPAKAAAPAKKAEFVP